MKRWLVPAAALAVLAFAAFGCGGNDATSGARNAAPLQIAGLTYVPVETLTVPVDSSAVNSTHFLQSGLGYRVTAWGTFNTGGPGDGLADAEYADFSNPPGSVVDECARDTVTTVDFGLAINDAVVDSTRNPDWGAFASDHVYTTTVIGAGAPLTFNYHDCNYSGNSGSLNVAIDQPALEIEIDLKPGSGQNPVNPKSQGVTPIAILGSADFVVADMDMLSLSFGSGQAKEAHGKAHPTDVNGDGFMDVVAHFRTQDLHVEEGDTEICLTATRLDGTLLYGCAPIRVVGGGSQGD